MVGAIAANLHEGSRSEYLAQYVFASFGTAVSVPHHEDSGIDLYCTLTERIGSRAWPRAYFSVQVKSTMDSWVLDGNDSVRWLVEHQTLSRFVGYHSPMIHHRVTEVSMPNYEEVIQRAG